MELVAEFLSEIRPEDAVRWYIQNSGNINQQFCMQQRRLKLKAKCRSSQKTKKDRTVKSVLQEIRKDIF